MFQFLNCVSQRIELTINHNNTIHTMKPLSFSSIVILLWHNSKYKLSHVFAFFSKHKKKLAQFLHKRDEIFLQTVSIIPQVLCNNVKHKEYMQKTQVVLS